MRKLIDRLESISEGTVTRLKTPKKRKPGEVYKDEKGVWRALIGRTKRDLDHISLPELFRQYGGSKITPDDKAVFWVGREADYDEDDNIIGYSYLDKFYLTKKDLMTNLKGYTYSMLYEPRKVLVPLYKIQYSFKSTRRPTFVPKGGRRRGKKQQFFIDVSK